TVVPLGTALYIAEARGCKLRLPDGSEATHDGYFFAGDVGGAIKQNHMDFFLGTTSKNPFPFVKSSQQDTVTASIVANSDVQSYLRSLHSA
ncbi:MAG TPA: 3D domain-containing protein, partial [Chthoniobacterales bacterium]